MVPERLSFEMIVSVVVTVLIVFRRAAFFAEFTISNENSRGYEAWWSLK
jgi:type IV secretory pathway VirB2 component (pilin)